MEKSSHGDVVLGWKRDEHGLLMGFFLFLVLQVRVSTLLDCILVNRRYQAVVKSNRALDLKPVLLCPRNGCPERSHPVPTAPVSAAGDGTWAGLSSRPC